MPGNPFTQASKVKRHLKVLLYGREGTGKTIAALTFPGVAIVDTEDGTLAYAGRDGVPEFMLLRSKSLNELDMALEFVRQDAGNTIKTLVIDSITVFYQLIRDEEVSKVEAKNKEFKGTDYGKVNRRMDAIYNRLSGLPVNVVVIARETDANQSLGGDLFKKVGDRPDSDKDIGYMFDFKIRMLGVADNFAGIVEKGRDPRGTITGKRLARVNYEALSELADLLADGEELKSPVRDLREPATAKQFRSYWEAKGVSLNIVQMALGGLITKFEGGWDAAIELVEQKLSEDKDDAN